MLVTHQSFGFYLGWSGSTLQFRQNVMNVGSKSWLITYSSNITLSLPSYTGSALKRELNFCNGYLSLLFLTILLVTFQGLSLVFEVSSECLLRCFLGDTVGSWKL